MMEAITTIILFIAVPCVVARILMMPFFFLPQVLRAALTFILAVIGIIGLIVKQIIN